MNVDQYAVIQKVYHHELISGHVWWQLDILDGIVERYDVFDGSFEILYFGVELGHCAYQFFCRLSSGSGT